MLIRIKESVVHRRKLDPVKLERLMVSMCKDIALDIRRAAMRYHAMCGCHRATWHRGKPGLISCPDHGTIIVMTADDVRVLLKSKMEV